MIELRALQTSLKPLSTRASVTFRKGIPARSHPQIPRTGLHFLLDTGGARARTVAASPGVPAHFELAANLLVRPDSHRLFFAAALFGIARPSGKRACASMGAVILVFWAVSTTEWTGA